MNLIIIPFHDWRKCEDEGFRTRDVHFIKAIEKQSTVDKIVVINRPTTPLEILLKKRKTTLDGKVVLKDRNFKLYQMNEKIFVVDFISNDILGQILYRFKWFLNTYGNPKLYAFINKSLAHLGIQDKRILVQNLFSTKLVERFEDAVGIFDAWDNFLKFPSYQNIRSNIDLSYKFLAKKKFQWFTNSQENIDFFNEKYNPVSIKLIKNGVSTSFLKKESKTPEDLKNLKKPIIGFGGKISYLLNTDLINYIVDDNPELTFVFVGQLLNKDTFNAIKKKPNFHFLGDKHYSVYHSYVATFDICIIPYNIDNKQHGGDSIKAYEFLSYGKKTVGTPGNGLLELKDYMYITNDKEEFSKHLKSSVNQKERFNIQNYSWESKAVQILESFNA